MLSLQSAITVYFYKTWVESTQHIISLTPILVTPAQAAVGQNFENNFCQFVQNPVEKEKKKKKGNCKALCVKVQTQKLFFPRSVHGAINQMHVHNAIVMFTFRILSY